MSGAGCRVKRVSKSDFASCLKGTGRNAMSRVIYCAALLEIRSR